MARGDHIRVKFQSSGFKDSIIHYVKVDCYYNQNTVTAQNPLQNTE